ncbi:hypothetical protein A2422_01335 [Candidatus Woesebacteria bacterium RIFOXYC1_FULL_31_51]|uniref:Uncharacterized protein n=1 Tax=Candidatus Woesebacteria bacterium GW2011_GWC2_31_9 TaxID=1618586 RepID=A0A0F9YYP7_9BACT|nr:MAG: hypothetical protein UR17_C0001G0718 [Candidatus Woesebacteria bacterium GW2011_GWF1_31_35]KKP22671.1 MAG: hypothetical protein UR11_C0002G0051 [Candidatus Woesebacteria bacterium GW2011_GWC1_30_29]KKP25946.1 MAG: hypothetical protein UR13_C0006G0085 [Candidatus Woesebacteria bacterium GW2011_GWD1_31_12]KKP27172.1 MAG: hypothetical protein UR16_C0006G0061 [Candidatus Woesebacteria bacterium GW2011_GWB1_31_29]KKP30085.1 MAG: hypothetical protein UR20_C0057G0002 [Candidatus Woesebacteria 
MKDKGILVLLSILVMVFGFFAYLISSNKLTSPVKFETSINKIESTSKSDELVAIEKDLNETNLDTIDAELALIEKELK